MKLSQGSSSRSTFPATTIWPLTKIFLFFTFPFTCSLFAGYLDLSMPTNFVMFRRPSMLYEIVRFRSASVATTRTTAESWGSGWKCWHLVPRKFIFLAFFGRKKPGGAFCCWWGSGGWGQRSSERGFGVWLFRWVGGLGVLLGVG